MMINGTLILSAFFLSWSILLRHLAAFLIKDCTPQPIVTHWFAPVDLIATIWWLFAAYRVTTILPAYFIFLSALWITVHTDLWHMLISRFVSIYLVPVACILAIFNALSVTVVESILAAAIGYGFFWIVNKIFYCLKGHDGLGQGDFELMACIGAFTGILGCWFTLLFGSLFGTVIGCFYMLITRKPVRILPFGPFLALGAATFVLYQFEICMWLVGSVL